MKKIAVTILILLILLVALIAYKTLVKKRSRAVLPNDIVEMNGTKIFAGAGWGLVSMICDEGGFNLLPHAGKSIVIEQSLAIGKFYNKRTPLNLVKIYADHALICEYYADSIGWLMPGIFPINHPLIIF